jgi:hypothetical protein
MPLYHLHAALNTTHGKLPKHSTSTLTMLKTSAVDILLRQGVISIAETPPLAILPGYEALAETLAAYSVVTIADFIIMLENAPGDLARILNTDVATLENHRAALESNWLSLPIQGG